jgi:hypothetical protein
MLITGGLKYLENMPTTDNTVREGKKFFDLAQKNIGNNPQAASNYLYQGLNFISAESESIKKQAQPFFKTNAEEMRLGEQQKTYDTLKKESGGSLSPEQINQIISSQLLKQPGKQLNHPSASNGKQYTREQLAAIAGGG